MIRISLVHPQNVGFFNSTFVLTADANRPINWCGLTFVTPNRFCPSNKNCPLKNVFPFLHYFKFWTWRCFLYCYSYIFIYSHQFFRILFFDINFYINRYHFSQLFRTWLDSLDKDFCHIFPFFSRFTHTTTLAPCPFLNSQTAQRDKSLLSMLLY